VPRRAGHEPGPRVQPGPGAQPKPVHNCVSGMTSERDGWEKFKSEAVSSKDSRLPGNGDFGGSNSERCPGVPPKTADTLALPDADSVSRLTLPQTLPPGDMTRI